MLNSYKNKFIELVTRNGFVPNDFEVKESEKGNKFVLKLIGTPLNFEIYQSPSDFHRFRCRYTEFKYNFPLSEYIPKVSKIHPRAIYEESYIYPRAIYDEFEKWLNTIVTKYFKELRTPDLWQQVQNQDSMLKGTEITDSDLLFFSKEEKAKIRLSIDEFELLIMKAFNPSKDKIRIIENRLMYLSESLDRLNKIDWKGIAISTVISISIALSLDPEKGKLLFNIFKQVFSGILKLMQ